jgi:hypothetical protein
MGLISLPIMLRYGYDRRVAGGVIAASGTLAQIIPPSLVLIVLAAVTVQVIWCYRACCLATTTPEPPSDPSHVHVHHTVTHPGRRDSDVVTQRRETAFGIPLGRASTNAGYQSLEMAPSR